MSRRVLRRYVGDEGEPYLDDMRPDGKPGNSCVVAKAIPEHMSGWDFRMRPGAEGVRQTMEATGLTTRCRFIGGNALEAVPVGGEAYILSNLVLNWEDEEAIVALQNCRQGMAPQGKLSLVDWIIPAADEPREAFRWWDTVMTDLIMLTTFGSRRGRMRTKAEFQALLRAAGFTLTALVPTQASVWVIEAAPLEGAA